MNKGFSRIETIRNLLICVMSFFILSGPAAMVCMEAGLKVDASDWLGSKEATYLAGNEAGIDIASHVNVNGFISGQFQEAFEAGIGKAVPAKPFALLGYTSIQRAFISTSNFVFRWECIPTFFGSDYVYIPEEDVLMEIPKINENNLLEKTGKFGEGLSKFASVYPDKMFYVVLVDRSSVSRVNPAIRLVSHTTTTDDCFKIMETRLSDSAQNICLMASFPSSVEEYKNYYYATDHHWNGWGALDLYTKLAENWDLKKANLESSLPNFEGLMFEGAFARGGLMLLNSEVHEPAYKLNGISIVDENGGGMHSF